MDDFDVNGILEEPVDFTGADTRDFEQHENLNLTHNGGIKDYDLYRKAQQYATVDMFDKDALENWYLRFEICDPDARMKKIEQLEIENMLYVTEQLKKLKNENIVNETLPISRRQVCPKDYPNKGLLSTPPVDDDWVGISTGINSVRKYIKLKKKEYIPIQLEKSIPIPEGEIDPWCEPYMKIYEKYQEEKCTSGNVIRGEANNEREINECEVIETKLLIHKYQCEDGYASLISDCSANRITLNWLKLWDKFIFDKEYVYVPDKPSWNERGIYDLEDSDDKKPEKKILGLFGPIGCCKTTLAKNISKFCGYNVIYIPVGDTLTVEQVKNKIERGITNVSMDFYLKQRDGMEIEEDIKIKPNCVIIDDIDYANTDIVNYLLKLSKEKGDKALKRPLILIGNNVYSSNLKDLKQNIAIVKVLPLFSNVLLKRLESICEYEGYNVKRYKLLEIMEECYYDIRRCLNNLQLMFAGTKISENYKIFNELSQDLSIVNIWEQIFIINRQWDTQGNTLPLSKRIERIQVMINRSEYADRIVFGLFQNINIVGYDNALFNKKILQIFEDIQFFYDLAINEQMYSLLTYRSAMVAKFHVMVAFKKQLRSKRLKFDFTGPSNYKPLQECKSLIHHIIKNKTFCNWSVTEIFNDLAPYLIFLLCPNIKHININFSSDEDLWRIRKSIQFMDQIGVTIKESEKTRDIYKAIDDGNKHTKLESTSFEPDITPLCIFFYDPIVKMRNSESERRVINSQIYMDKLMKYNKNNTSNDNFISGKEMQNRVTQILSILTPNNDHYKDIKKPKIDNSGPKIYYMWEDDATEIANTKIIRLCDF
uniref:AAA domain-containing protein n=1 Tax=Parastrongyloides trichosuri TaxID=131310 RepID=A0A0N4ZTM6_PARTI